MDNGLKPQVVHETETQRQHPRVRIPATVRIAHGNTEAACRVIDISVAGFAFEAPHSYQVGALDRGVLQLGVDSLALNLPVQFCVRNFDNSSRRTGCSFENLTAGTVATLHYLIGGYLSGEVTTAGEMLATLSRDNYSKPRAQVEPAPPLSPAGRLRALSLTGVMFVVGLAAFTYAASTLYSALFVMHANAAKIAASSFTIAMPRDGTFFNLIPPDGLVKKGQPIGTFQAAMLDVMQNDPGSLHLTPQQLSDLMGETLKGTISSPCDCRVQTQYAMDAQYINRNQPLLELVPQEAKPYVLARFHFDSIPKLSPGRSIGFHVGGESGDRQGTIRQLRLLPSPANPAEGGGSSDLRGLNGSAVISDVIVEIEPDEALPANLVDRPVDVRIGGADLPRFDWNRLRAYLPA
ncbi:MAG: PilZ protein [Nevskia sp.]|nr:PilZ protein [Nevskia sp.]